MTKRDMSYLHTPEVRAKRAKAIRKAFRNRKAKTNIVPLFQIPGETPPVLRHAAERRPRNDPEQERIELTRGIVALLYKALNG